MSKAGLTWWSGAAGIAASGGLCLILRLLLCAVWQAVKEERSEPLKHSEDNVMSDQAKKSALVIVENSRFQEDSILEVLRGVTLQEKHCNDVYKGYEGHLSDKSLLPLKVTLIYPAQDKHISKYRDQERVMILETPAVYEELLKPLIEDMPRDRIKWVDNILAGSSEADSIIVRDDDPGTGFVLLPDTKWHPKRPVDSLYCLAICLRKDVRSLRDLRGAHLPLLRKMRNLSRQHILEKYGLDPKATRAFIHYQPSYYHFHVHFTHWRVPIGASSHDRCYNLDEVIGNLEVDPDFYKKCTLSYLVGETEFADVLRKLHQPRALQ